MLIILDQIFIKNKYEYLSTIDEWWGINDLYKKFSSNDSEKYLIIFNYSKIWNIIKEWYKIINSWNLRDFIK